MDLGFEQKNEKLSDNDLIRMMRVLITAENEAINLYTRLADQVDKGIYRKNAKLVIDVLNDVAKEEKRHVGEFQSVLFTLCPDEEKEYKKGKKEVDKIRICVVT